MTDRIIIFIILLVIPMIPTFWAITHISKGAFATTGQRYRWLALVVFLPPIGGLIYLFFGRKKRLGLLTEAPEDPQEEAP